MSSSTDRPAGRVTVGHVARAHGVRGEVLAIVASDVVAVVPGLELQTADGRTLRVARARPARGGMLIGFDTVHDRNDAERLRGAELTVDAAQRRVLEAGEYWPEQLVGLDAYDERDDRLGSIERVILGPAQDRLVLRLVDGRVAEIPFVDDLVPAVDLASGRLTVRPIAGLLGEP